MDNNCIKIYYENAFEKIARSRIEDYKNALHCCRVSGNVYNQGSVDNMLCLQVLHKRGFSFIMETTKPNKALPKCKKETQQ